MATDCSREVLSAEYREPVRFTLLQQVPVAVLCLLMLDGGRMARVCGIAMVGFWCGVFLLWLRRPRQPTRTDLAFLRWGFFPIFAASLALAAFWLRRHGA